ncbi:MAG: hypothetical protein ABSE86_32395 [Bryobacteraceae bacterium]
MKSLGGAAGILTGITFVSGWLYWSTYYTAFGLNPLVLDFPIPVVSVSISQVLVRDSAPASGLGAPILIALIVCVALSGLFVYWRTRGHRGSGFVLLLAALIMLVGAWRLGYHDADLDAGCNSRLPTVAFLLTTAPDAADAPPSCLNNMLSCKLVLHSSGVYHFFEIPDCSAGFTNTVGAGLATAEVLDAQVKMVRILRSKGL